MAAAAAAAASSSSRRLRAFKRWMKQHNIQCSDALEIIDNLDQGISVRAASDLQDGQVVATIPKQSCLTIKTSGAHNLIESAALDGLLGLAVAVMYERSLGHRSPWFGYLQLLPEYEPIPLLWTLEEVDSLLIGTELHESVKEDKALVFEDWKESILPLLTDSSSSLDLDPDFFTVEHYFAAKSLIASRSFEIDDHHGFGMVPLADLFNHKTGSEDVHFTSNSSADSDDSDPEDAEDEDDPNVLEMIMVKDVKTRNEVFNTYGCSGNAALLHRYGFTELNNPFDIINIDLDLVLQWGSNSFSSRHFRARLSLWRRLGYSGCVGDSAEYFEVSSNGEPQIELLILLCIVLLPDEEYSRLDIAGENLDEFLSLNLGKGKEFNLDFADQEEKNKFLLHTKEVCDAILAIADIREKLYGSDSIEEDIEALKRCCSIRERKKYHSLVLRVSERRVLEKLRSYSAASAQECKTDLAASTARKKKKKLV